MLKYDNPNETKSKKKKKEERMKETREDGVARNEEVKRVYLKKRKRF